MILEVVGAVIGLFGSADFFGTSAADFIADLPEPVQADSIEASKGKIASMVTERQRCGEESDELLGKVNDQQTALQEYAELEGSEFLLFARLSADIAKHGGFFVNLSYSPEQKQREASLICDALDRLYGPEGCSNSDPLSVQQDLIKLQESWKFETAKGYFGQQTLVALMNEYLLLVRRQR